MIVREMLLNALANAGHIHDGKSAESDELELALRLFNSEMKTLSNRNLITAYQRVLDIPEASQDMVVGGYSVTRGRKVYEFTGELPSADGYVSGRDFALLDGTKWYVATSSDSGTNTWEECLPGACCDAWSDVIVPDMERIVTAMYRNSAGQWNNLRFVPLSMFYSEDDDLTYCTTAEGENRIRLRLPKRHEGNAIKLVYNTEMEFAKNDSLDLPDAHITLVEIATTVAILRKDADTDPTRLNNYRAQLQEISDDIMANTSTERRIMRHTDTCDRDRLRSGAFIFR